MASRSRRLVLSLGILVGCPAGMAQGQQGITVLEPGVAVQRELAGGQQHVYQLSLLQDQYARVVVEQRGVDVIIRVFGTDGQSIAEFDSELRVNGEEPAALIASATGVHTIQIESKYKADAAGRYQIEFSEL